MQSYCQENDCQLRADFSCGCDQNLRLCGSHFLNHTKINTVPHSNIRLSEIYLNKAKIISEIKKKIRKTKEKIKSDFKAHLSKLIEEFNIYILQFKEISNQVHEFEISPQLKFENSSQRFEEMLKKLHESFSNEVLLKKHKDAIPEWEIRNVILSHTIDTPNEVPISILISRDQTSLYSGFASGLINIYSLSNYANIYFLRGHSSHVFDLKLSLNEKTLFSASMDKSIIVWNLSSRRQEFSLNYSDSVRSLYLYKNGQCLVGGSWDKTIRFWNLTSRSQEFTINNYSDVIAIVFTSNEKQLLSGSRDYKIRSWNVDERKLEFELTGHTDTITSIGIFKKDSFAYSSSSDKTIKIWSLLNRNIEFTLFGHTSKVYTTFLTEDENFLVSGSDDKLIKFWNLQKQKEYLCVHGHELSLCQIIPFNHRKGFISSSLDQKIKIWNIEYLGNHK